MMILSKLTILHSTQPLQIFDGWSVFLLLASRRPQRSHSFDLDCFSSGLGEEQWSL